MALFGTSEEQVYGFEDGDDRASFLHEESSHVLHLLSACENARIP